MRQLRGVQLRNLTADSATIASTRPRSSTQDDDRLDTSWQTASKQRTAGITTPPPKHVPHSSLDLAGSSSPLGRPGLQQQNRRISFLRAGAIYHNDPVRTQRKLDRVINTQLLNSFFSLHAHDAEETLLYISEVARHTMNPSYQSFDLDNALAFTSVHLQVWIRGSTDSNDKPFHRLLDLDIWLAKLRYMGTSLTTFRFAFASNTLILRLSDGYYTLNDSQILPPTLPKQLSESATTRRQRQTYSYEILLQMTQIESVILETQFAAIKVKEKLTAASTATASALLRITRAEVRARVNRTKSLLMETQESLHSLQKTSEKLREAISDRRKMHSAAQLRLKSSKFCELDRTQRLSAAQSELESVKISLRSARQRICHDLQLIYPVTATTIRDIPLPNSDFTPSDLDKAKISASLGYTAHFVYLLGQYLAVPFRYPIQPISSVSLIRDPISIMSGSRTFPLYITANSAVDSSHRFNYGVFLLNKDIEQLVQEQHRTFLQLTDLRMTLPNLKILLDYITASIEI